MGFPRPRPSPQVTSPVQTATLLGKGQPRSVPEADFSLEKVLRVRNALAGKASTCAAGTWGSVESPRAPGSCGETKPPSALRGPAAAGGRVAPPWAGVGGSPAPPECPLGLCPASSLWGPGRDVRNARAPFQALCTVPSRTSLPSPSTWPTPTFSQTQTCPSVELFPPQRILTSSFPIAITHQGGTRPAHLCPAGPGAPFRLPSPGSRTAAERLPWVKAHM